MYLDNYTINNRPYPIDGGAVIPTGDNWFYIPLFVSVDKLNMSFYYRDRNNIHYVTYAEGDPSSLSGWSIKTKKREIQK